MLLAVMESRVFVELDPNTVLVKVVLIFEITFQRSFPIGSPKVVAW
jgi:hypothetical protein